jgi:hypothetical protein
MTKPDALTLTLPEGTLTVTVKRRARKTVSISIRDGQVALSAPPHVPRERLLALLEDRRDWIVRHWREQQVKLAQARILPASIDWLGQPLALYSEPAARREVRRTSTGLLVRGVDPHSERETYQRLVATWIKREASLEFCQRLMPWAKRMGLQPATVGLTSARRRWGSCSASGAIRLNWRLLMAPPAVLDYVIVHELAHLVHLNHSDAFWHEVERWMPDWPHWRLWLKQHGERLFAFG